ncbi:MAG: DUF3253 domain-containing protein [Verrucomicrobiae bacterium]|nr:DUF3253 domain-containing protein [Verrucomicrobiae bacterium]
MSQCPSDAEITDVILALTAARGPAKSICPSEAARYLAGEGGDWRALMGDVRRVAADLASAGKIEITQGGQPVATGPVSGPVRLRITRDGAG